MWMFKRSKKHCKCKKIPIACTQSYACSVDEYLNPFTIAVSSDEDSDEDIRSDSEDTEKTIEFLVGPVTLIANVVRCINLVIHI